jgi:hypothetical protein
MNKRYGKWIIFVLNLLSYIVMIGIMLLYIDTIRYLNSYHSLPYRSLRSITVSFSLLISVIILLVTFFKGRSDRDSILYFVIFLSYPTLVVILAIHMNRVNDVVIHDFIMSFILFLTGILSVVSQKVIRKLFIKHKLID